MDKKVCPDCKREYALEDETCVDCGSKLEIKEVLDPENWMIVYHESIRENVDDVAKDLAAHGIEGRVRYVDLTKLNISLTSASTWALLVPRESAEAAVEMLHKLYGYTEEAEKDDIEALGDTYGFLQASVEQLAADESLRADLCNAMRDQNLPESLAEKARDALIAAGSAAEDEVLGALVSEICQDHYATKGWAFEPLIEILAESGTDKTSIQLLALCLHDDSMVRINALHCAGWLCSDDHVNALPPLLEDPDADVRQEADGALEELTGESVCTDHILTPEDGRKARAKWEEFLGVKP